MKEFQVALFDSGPGLLLSLDEEEEFVGSAFEVDFILEGSNELGEIAVDVSGIEIRALKLDGDKRSGSSDGSGLKRSEVSSQGAIRVLVEQIESREDGIEEVEVGTGIGTALS